MTCNYSSFMKSMPVGGVIFHLNKATALAKSLIEYRTKKDSNGLVLEQLPYCCAVKISNAGDDPFFMYSVQFSSNEPESIKYKSYSMGREIEKELYWRLVTDEDIGESKSLTIGTADITNFDRLVEDWDIMNGQLHL